MFHKQNDQKAQQVNLIIAAAWKNKGKNKWSRPAAVCHSLTAKGTHMGSI